MCLDNGRQHPVPSTISSVSAFKNYFLTCNSSSLSSSCCYVTVKDICYVKTQVVGCLQSGGDLLHPHRPGVLESIAYVSCCTGEKAGQCRVTVLSCVIMVRQHQLLIDSIAVSLFSVRQESLSNF